MADKIEVTMNVNGTSRTCQVYPMARLLDILREDFALTGTKEGCGEGECGACSVFLDGRLVNSCLVPAAQCQKARITTIEGIGKDETFKVVQQAFLEKGGAQCGICTPGMIIAAVNLLKNNKDPSLEDIQNGLAGNLCRCTGYVKIFDAVKEAARLWEAKA